MWALHMMRGHSSMWKGWCSDTVRLSSLNDLFLFDITGLLFHVNIDDFLDECIQFLALTLILLNSWDNWFKSAEYHLPVTHILFSQLCDNYISFIEWCTSLKLLGFLGCFFDQISTNRFFFDSNRRPLRLWLWLFFLLLLSFSIRGNRRHARLSLFPLFFLFVVNNYSVSQHLRVQKV